MAIRLVESNNINILIDEDYMDNEDDNIFEALDFDKSPCVSVIRAGRGNVAFFEHSGKSMVQKHYLRGGLISKFIVDQYLWLNLELTRSFIEFRALEKMSQLGLPVPKPIAARVSRYWGYYTADLITEKIENTKTLGDYLQDQTFSEQISLIIGKTIKSFHSNECYHPDLNVENILIGEAQGVFLVDFDRWKSRNVTKRSGAKNIARLKRSINKLCDSKGLPFPRKTWQSLLDAYHVTLR